MVLVVEFDDFAAAAKRHLGEAVAYVAKANGPTMVTAADSRTGALVQSSTMLSPLEVRKRLEADGLTVVNGRWTLDPDATELDAGKPVWIAAVAYKSSDKLPGLWVDAYPERPTTGDVLTALYEEFGEEGDLQDISLEEFIRIGQPNVVIVSPEELDKFARKHAQTRQGIA